MVICLAVFAFPARYFHTSKKALPACKNVGFARFGLPRQPLGCQFEF